MKTILLISFSNLPNDILINTIDILFDDIQTVYQRKHAHLMNTGEKYERIF